MKCETCGNEAGGTSVPIGDENPRKWAFECSNCGDTWTASLIIPDAQVPVQIENIPQQKKFANKIALVVVFATVAYLAWTCLPRLISSAVGCTAL